MEQSYNLEVYYQGKRVITYPLKGALVTFGSDLAQADYLLPFAGVPPLALVLLRNNDGTYSMTRYGDDGPVAGAEEIVCGQEVPLTKTLKVAVMSATLYSGATKKILPTIGRPVKGLLVYGNIELPVDDVIMVGQGDNNDLVVADEYLSKNHFLIIRRNNRYFLRDLASTNGTFVDNHLIVEAELGPNSLIKAGDSLFKFTITIGEESSVSLWHGLVGCSPAMMRLEAQITKAARSNLPVFIHGETGSGKELVAKAIYDLSCPLGTAPYVVRNCATFTENLLSSELFGHRRGAFTGAVENQPGAFVAASGGCLFLDELGELPLNMQPALLRAVEYGEVTPIGSNTPVKVNVRLIGASHRDLRQMVAQGKFRQDLYYRLSAFPLEIPPLRERGGDILLLANHFLKHFGAGDRSFSPRAQAKLLAYNWPGNVRELSNCIQLTLCHTESREIGADELLLQPAGLQNTPAEDEQPMIDRETLVAVLKRNHGNKSKAAESIGIARSTIYRMIRQQRISRDEIK